MAMPDETLSHNLDRQEQHRWSGRSSPRTRSRRVPLRWFFRVLLVPSLLLAQSVPSLAQTPLGTAYTYQGQLQSSGSPANGSYNLVFKLWNDPSLSAPANQVGPTLTFDGVGGNPPPVVVANGLFTQQLDFGAGAFDGNKRWLEITVGGTTLSPRQELTATPYARFSAAPWATNGNHISNTNSANVGVGTPSPASKLDVAGTVQATGLKLTTSPTAGHVLTSDASGNGTWQAPTGGGFALPYSGSANSSTVFSLTNTSAGGGSTCASFQCTDGGSAATYGVQASSFSSNGVGVKAYGSIGVLADGSGSSGYAGYFRTGQNYFENNVGIGTTSPGNSLTIAGANNFGAGGASIYVTNTTAFSGRTYLVGSTTGGLFQIGDVTAGLATRLVVDASGNVGIGTVSPGQKLQVAGNICASGTISVCSDGRFKKNVTELTDALDLVMQLRGVTFDWKREDFADHQFAAGRQVGFIAQEVERVLPQVVSQGSDGYLSVDYGRLMPALVEAVKELKREQDGEMKSLRAENADLKARLDRLEALMGTATALTKAGTSGPGLNAEAP